MSGNHENPPATDVRPLPGHDPFTLVPLIDDILRTRYCVPGSIFLLEGIESAPVSKSGRWQAVQLLLGDGHLCIQALLSGPLHRFIHTGEVSVGSCIRVENFYIKQTEVLGDGTGANEMVYLVIEDLVTVGWSDSFRTLWQQETNEALEELVEENDLDLEEARLEYKNQEVDNAQMADYPEEGKPGDKVDEEEDDAAFEDAFEAFEALTFPVSTKRQEKAKSDLALAESQPAQPVALPRDWHDRHTPLKLTTLRSIPNLPYAQNWSCNVLAIVASLSPIESSYLPPYRQRTARLADPSTAKQVHLSVFLAPESFVPKIGSAVLLVGVKNHRFDGGSLKKYASDAEKAGGSTWWFEDPLDLGWCDVEGIKKWWADRHMAVATD